MKFIILGILSLLSVQPSLAGVVPVREVRLQVFEKEVTGYRVNIAIAEEELRAGIQRYFAAYPTMPVRMQEGLIYENLAYPPITTAKPITLYYTLKDQEGIFTELTLVGLYTYQQDINIDQFPDLSLRMLLDLSEMIQTLTGDPIDFDALFERQSVKEIRQRYQDRKERNYMDFYVQREGDWIGSEEATLVKKNPFGDNKPENFETDDQVLELISDRFKRYVDQNRSQSSPFLNDSSQQQFMVWRDSASILSQKIQSLELMQDSLLALMPDTTELDTVFLTEIFTDSSLIDSLSQTLSDLNMQVQKLELTLALSQERSDSLLAMTERSPQEQSDSLSSPITIMDTLILTETRVDTITLVETRIDTVQVQLSPQSAEASNLSEIAAQNAKTEARLAQLSRRNSVLEEENNKLQGLSAQYDKLNLQYEQLEDRFEQTERAREETALKASKLEKSSSKLTQDKLLLLAERDSIIQELIILNPESEAARLKREVYRRQLDQLTEKQQTQARREQELARREKQIEQRERYLAEFESTGDEQTLLERIIQLENQINTQKQENEDLRAAINHTQRNFQISQTNDPAFGTVYRFKTGENEEFDQEQILTWFRVRAIFPSQQKPLRFEAVSIPSINDELLQLSFVSLSNAWWVLSFQLVVDGEILTLAPSIEEVEGLLTEIFR